MARPSGMTHVLTHDPIHVLFVMQETLAVKNQLYVAGDAIMPAAALLTHAATS